MSEKPTNANRRPSKPNRPQPSTEERAGPATGAATESVVLPSAPAGPSAETASDQAITPEVTEVAQQPDRVAAGLALGVIALLLICTALLLAAA